jgi:hypothetical protein
MDEEDNTAMSEEDAAADFINDSVNEAIDEAIDEATSNDDDS